MKRLIISTITIFLFSLLSFTQNIEPTYIFNYTTTGSSSNILDCNITKPDFQNINCTGSSNCTIKDGKLKMETNGGTTPNASFNLEFTPFAIPLTKIVVTTTETTNVELKISYSIKGGNQSYIQTTSSNNEYEFILDEPKETDKINFSIEHTVDNPSITIEKIEIYTDHRQLIVSPDETKTITGNVYYDEVIVVSDQTCNTGQILFADENSTLTTDCFKIHKFLDDKQWYFFSSPFDFKINDIKFIDTKIDNELKQEDNYWKYGSNYKILYYNQTNAALGVGEDDNVVYKGWTDTKSEELLYNNFGHMIGLSPKNCQTTMVLEYNKSVTLKHPNKYTYIVYESLQATDGEAKKGLQIWYNDRAGQNDAIFDINKVYEGKSWNWCNRGNDFDKCGWNFVSIPFLNNFQENSVIEIPLQGSYNPDNKDNTKKENPLISIPNYNNFKTYNQMSLKDAIKNNLVKPCSPFFVQLGAAEPPIYKFGNAPTENPRKNAAQIDNSSTAEIYVTAPDNKNDRTTIISEGGMTTDYEIGYDLLKLIGYADLPQLYSIQDSTILAYNTLEISNTTTIPLGIFVPQDGEYTFSLGDKSNFDVMMLNDADNGTTTNLKIEDYRTVINRGEYKDRFSITLRNNYLPTDNKVSNLNVNAIAYKEGNSINIDQIPDNAEINIFDSLGRLIEYANTVSSSYRFEPEGNGIYIITIKSENNTSTIKAIY